MTKDLRGTLERNVLVGDGAMGTYLYQMGFPVGISYEELNLLKPDVITDVHRRYYEAGARFIETNTFSATREKLAKFGLEREVVNINRAGVEIARKAVGDDAFVMGAVGSIRSGMRRNVMVSQLKEDFQQQIVTLLDSGVDGIILETFFDLEELMIALSIVRQFSKVPVVCQFATEGGGNTHDGVPMQEAYRILQDNGADVVGFNCRVGPNGIIRSLEQLSAAVPGDMRFSAFPNAGIPDYVDGRYTYMATPEYFAESALRLADLGARVIGGCCGTTPEHISAMVQALKGFQFSEDQVANEPPARIEVVRSQISRMKPSTPFAPLGVRLLDAPPITETVKHRHTVIVELDPPRDLDISVFMEGSAALKEAKVDALTMADNSLAMTRMSNMPMGFLVKEQVGLRPLLHIACRDRNLIGTQSHLMGMHALGIDHVLAVTGDPARFGDLPGSSSVYDMSSFEMIRMIKQLNDGIAFSGKQLDHKANFVIGAAFNPNVKYLDRAVRRLELKIEAGADYVMTQPIYDPVLFREVSEATKHLEIPIFIGIMPLASGGNAEYLHNEVPGIQLSDEVRARMAGLRGEEGRAMGVNIAKELLDEAIPYFNGIYMMTPFLQYGMSVELTRYIWDKTRALDNPLYPLSK